MGENFGVLTVQDIWLAAALASFDVPFYQPDPIRRVRKDGREICLFNFESGGPGARGGTGAEIVKQWADKTFIESNPEHPLAYILAFTHNRERLLDLVKQSPQVQIEQKGGKIFFVPIRKPQESQ
jgi:hypothetical protein